MTEAGSTVPRRELGRLLREMREQAGIGLEAAGKDLEFSRATMYRIESGQTAVRAADVEAMCRLYQVPGDMTQVLVSLAKESKSRGWYHAYGEVIPRWFELYVGLESAASRIRTYEHALVPGLLQTPEYAARLVGSRPGATEAEVNKRVALRMERQRILHRVLPAAPQVEVIIEETLLHKRMPEMAGQIDHLVKASESMSIRVVPLVKAHDHFAVTGSFVVLEFPNNGTRSAEPTTVYHEGLSGALYLDRPDEVRSYAEAWNCLVTNSLSEETSRKLMMEIKEKTCVT